MNQRKLEVVKQEMARVNVDILGISELKWTRMGEFNSDDHYIYYCARNPSEVLCLEGVPDLPVAPQDEAGLTKTFQTWPRGWFHIP